MLFFLYSVNHIFSDFFSNVQAEKNDALVIVCGLNWTHLGGLLTLILLCMCVLQLMTSIRLGHKDYAPLFDPTRF